MKSTIIEKTTQKKFEEVVSDIKGNIISSEFLLIHEIDTQEIMAKHGIKIKPLRQLLFFHPRYMNAILNSDPLAVNAVPLKVVIREVDDHHTNISFPSPVMNFKGYSIDQNLVAELFDKMNSVVSTLS